MEDENEVSVESTEENVSHETNSKPAGYYPVDPSNADPVEIKNRIDYLYRQVKDNERSLNEYRGIAKSQSEKIEELLGGFGQVVDHIHTKEYTENENNLRYQIRQAYEAGDVNKFEELNEKLLDMKLEKKLQKKPEPQKQKPEQTRVPVNQITNDALSVGELTQEDLTYLESWQGEVNGGQKSRPWATEDHPMYPQAYDEMLLVFTNPVYETLTFNQKLEELDRRMGVKKQSGGQTVMGGNLTTRGKTSKITLSPKQQEIAIRTKFGGPKAKSDADHLEAYRKQLQDMSATKRGR